MSCAKLILAATLVGLVSGCMAQHPVAGVKPTRNESLRAMDPARIQADTMGFADDSLPPWHLWRVQHRGCSEYCGCGGKCAFSFRLRPVACTVVAGAGGSTLEFRTGMTMNTAQEAKRGAALHVWISWLAGGFRRPLSGLRSLFAARSPLSRAKEKQRRKALVRKLHGPKPL